MSLSPYFLVLCVLLAIMWATEYLQIGRVVAPSVTERFDVINMVLVFAARIYSAVARRDSAFVFLALPYFFNILSGVVPDSALYARYAVTSPGMMLFLVLLIVRAHFLQVIFTMLTVMLSPHSIVVFFILGIAYTALRIHPFFVGKVVLLMSYSKLLSMQLVVSGASFFECLLVTSIVFLIFSRPFFSMSSTTLAHIPVLFFKIRPIVLASLLASFGDVFLSARSALFVDAITILSIPIAHVKIALLTFFFCPFLDRLVTHLRALQRLRCMAAPLFAQRVAFLILPQVSISMGV